MALAHNPTLTARKQLSIQDVNILVTWAGSKPAPSTIGAFCMNMLNLYSYVRQDIDDKQNVPHEDSHSLHNFILVI